MRSMFHTSFVFSAASSEALGAAVVADEADDGLAVEREDAAAATDGEEADGGGGDLLAANSAGEVNVGTVCALPNAGGDLIACPGDGTRAVVFFPRMPKKSVIARRTPSAGLGGATTGAGAVIGSSSSDSMTQISAVFCLVALGASSTAASSGSERARLSEFGWLPAEEAERWGGADAAGFSGVTNAGGGRAAGLSGVAAAGTAAAELGFDN